MTVVDAFTRHSIALGVRRSFTSRDVIDVLRTLLDQHGSPAYLRSDNGPEFVAKKVEAG